METAQYAPAIALLNQTLETYPHFYFGWLKLSQCLFDADFKDKAVDVAKQAEQFDPLTQDFGGIQQHMQRNALAEAATLAKQMLIKCPHHPRALFTLAHICLARNVPEKGIALLERELTYVPANVTLRKMLADCYERSGQFEHAISTANSLVNLNESFESLWHLIGLLFKYSQHHELLNACARAQKLAGEDQQKHSQVALIRGQSLRISGRRNEAIAAFKVSIETYNYNVDAWLALADMKNYQFSQAEMQQLELLISALDNDKCSKAKASFALAKAIELNRGIEKSMPFYESANRLVSGITFSESLMQAEFDARISTYTKRAIELQGDTQPMQPRPIFIVGMPRSGSTLVDQILASHPLIAGTIEQPTLPYIERRAQQMCRSSYNKDLHHGLSLLDEHQLTSLGNSYLESGHIFRPQHCKFFTDKQLFNYRLLGLIHKILPDAIIIDVRRNAMDCGLSLFKQYFHAGVDFSYNLEHIAFAIKQYKKIMEHWHSVMPGRIITVRYEALIQSPEEQIHQLLEQIGLPFDKKCLDFHTYRRDIHTASSEQVREPLHERSINVWEKVKSHLRVLEYSLVDSDKREPNT